MFGVKGSATEKYKYCQLSEKLHKWRRETNVACHEFNVSKSKSLSDDSSKKGRRRRQWREFKATQQLEKRMQRLHFAGL